MEDFDELAWELRLDIDQDAQDLLQCSSPRGSRWIIRKKDEKNRYVALTMSDFNTTKSQKDGYNEEKLPSFVATKGSYK